MKSRGLIRREKAINQSNYLTRKVSGSRSPMWVYKPKSSMDMLKTVNSC